MPKPSLTDELLWRLLKRSLTKLAAFRSSNKLSNLKTSSQSIHQVISMMIALINQQLAHFEAVQHNVEDTLADMLLQSHASCLTWRTLLEPGWNLFSSMHSFMAHPLSLLLALLPSLVVSRILAAAAHFPDSCES